jgi:hypothetical protein
MTYSSVPELACCCEGLGMLQNTSMKGDDNKGSTSLHIIFLYLQNGKKISDYKHSNNIQSLVSFF